LGKHSSHKRKRSLFPKALGALAFGLFFKCSSKVFPSKKPSFLKSCFMYVSAIQSTSFEISYLLKKNLCDSLLYVKPVAGCLNSPIIYLTSLQLAYLEINSGHCALPLDFLPAPPLAVCSKAISVTNPIISVKPLTAKAASFL